MDIHHIWMQKKNTDWYSLNRLQLPSMECHISGFFDVSIPNERNWVKLKEKIPYTVKWHLLFTKRHASFENEIYGRKKQCAAAAYRRFTDCPWLGWGSWQQSTWRMRMVLEKWLMPIYRDSANFDENYWKAWILVLMTAVAPSFFRLLNLDVKKGFYQIACLLLFLGGDRTIVTCTRNFKIITGFPP